MIDKIVVYNSFTGSFDGKAEVKCFNSQIEVDLPNSLVEEITSLVESHLKNNKMQLINQVDNALSFKQIEHTDSVNF